MLVARKNLYARIALRYGMAIAAVAAATALRLALARVINLESRFLLFFPAVVLAALYGGLGPGILAATLGALASDYFFSNPAHSFGFIARENRAQVGLFFVEGILLSVVGAMLRKARRRAEAADSDARRLEQKILDASEQERRRIGHDLHDGLGQHLTGIALLSKALRQRLAALKLPEAEQAKQVAELVNESITWTRDLARGLSPVSIEADGLAPALEELATNASKLMGVRCVTRCDGEVPVDGETALHLYRIAQEAVNNSVRHGKAKSAVIEITTDPASGLRMTILDDGGGLSEKTRVHPGIGLQIMQYRARMIGATLSVSRASEDGGTIVTCAIPAARLNGLTGSANAMTVQPQHRHESRHESSNPPGGRPSDRPAGAR